ncbi:MAG: hypothetical protein QOE68_1874, partial [Thermoanaerobaculia bacterium]|nr:hypothetical protein [Thermoanaerobaculia bacterium]
MRGATHRQRLLLILLAAAIPSFAQQQPNLEKGFHADKAYSSADLDHVNLFSGNLNVVIPLGQRYRVSSALDYGFTLVYSGNNWDTEFGETQVYEHIPGAGPDDYHWVTKQQNYSVPYRRSNAGLGWTFSLGRIINDTSPTKKCDCIVYQAPDGSEHSFMSTLHGAGANATTGYTNDNTYLRLRNGASWFVDFPDGNVHEFDKTSGDLKSITDPFGQTVSVSYSTVTSPDTEACGTSQVRRWDVTDSTGRHHYLDFRNDIQPYVSKGMVCRADLAAFGGQRSVYRMTYLVRTISRQAVYTETQNPAGVGEVTSVPLLASVELPGGAGSYAAIYDIGVKRNGSVLVGVTSDDTVNIPDATSDILAAQTPGSFTGHLISLQLPTRAKIAWTYAQYTLPPGPPPTPEPNGSGEFVQYTTRAAGVKTREITLNASTAPAVWTYDSAAENLYVSKTTVTEPATTTGPQTATTTYFSMCENCNVLPYKAVEYGLPVYRWEMPAQITSTIQNSYTIPSGATLSLVMNGSTSTVSLSSGVKTVNQLVTALNLSNSFNTRFYASASSDGRLVIRSGAVGSTVSFSIDGSSPSSAHGALGLDTATHEGSTDNVEDGHYLSSVVKDTSGNILKKTYVSYETDPNVPPLFGPFAYDYNRRLSGETVLTMKPGGSDRAFVNYSDFDGLGHYRTTVTGGNFGYGNVRTETVNYNKPDSDVDADAYESTPESGFQMPPNWILNRYSSRSSTENGGTAKTNYWFDADTGFLKRQRVLASGTSQAANDTIAEFTSTNGNVTREEYFGGDLTPANMLDFPSEDPGTGLVSDIRLSTISLSTAKYRLDHIYDKGSLKSSRYVNTATTQAMPFFIVDNDIDANTGLPSASRDAAGLATSFSYDLLGRLTTTTPPAGLTATTIAYHDATPTTKASVDVSTTPTASHVDYDELGRVRLEWSQFAANAWSVTESLYDAAGRKHKVSSPESASAV